MSFMVLQIFEGQSKDGMLVQHEYSECVTKFVIIPNQLVPRPDYLSVWSNFPFMVFQFPTVNIYYILERK